MIEQDIRGVDDWILAGSVCGWGEPLADHFTMVIFLYLPAEQRMERLAWRENERHGSRVEPGGDMHVTHKAFMKWAASYDQDGTPGRSLQIHEAWMEQLECPVLRLDSGRPETELVDEIVQHPAIASGR